MNNEIQKLLRQFQKTEQQSSDIWSLAFCFIGMLVLVGCASTEVTNRQRLVHERLPRPNSIFIYDFAASPADVPSYSMYASQNFMAAGLPSDEQTTVGRQLGITLAAGLIDDIREMGLPAQRGGPETKMQVNDIVIRGYLVSVEQGSAAKRMTIGFGSGGSELTTAIEGFQMTDRKSTRLNSSHRL